MTWSENLISRIAAQINEFRGNRSFQWMEDRTASLGHRVSRTTIFEIVNGKRQTISLADVIVLAAALDVSVADLIYPGYGEVEILPGQAVNRARAISALGGSNGAELLAATAAVGVIKSEMTKINELSTFLIDTMRCAE